MTQDVTIRSPSIEEALNLDEEPTITELTQQALVEASSERILKDERQETQGEPRIIPFPSTIIPASSVENPLVTPISIEELPDEKATQDGKQPIPELEALIAYANSTITHRMVNSIIQVIGSTSTMIPLPALWDLPPGTDIAGLVMDIVTTPDFLVNVWPQLKILMGKSVGNVPWMASVAITLAFFESLKLLPIIKACGILPR